MLIPVFRAGSRKARKLLHLDARQLRRAEPLHVKQIGPHLTPATFLFRHHHGLGNYNLHGPLDPRMRFFWSPTLIVTVRKG